MRKILIAVVIVLLLCLVSVASLKYFKVGPFSSAAKAENGFFAALSTEKNFATQNQDSSVTDCQPARLVDGSENQGKVLNNIDNGDGTSWAVTVVNPDHQAGDQTLVVITDPGATFDIEYALMYYNSARFEGSQKEVACSAETFSDGTGEIFVFVGALPALDGWQWVDSSKCPAGEVCETSLEGWWDTFKVWNYEEKPLDAGKAVESFISADAKDRSLSSINGVVVTHGQTWCAGFPGKIVNPQIAEGYTLTVPACWQGTFWSYTDPEENIQERVIQTTREQTSRDEVEATVATVIMPFCGPQNEVPETSLEYKDKIWSWATTTDQGKTWTVDGKVVLKGWSCTGPSDK